MANAFELKENRQKILEHLVNDLYICKYVLLDDSITEISEGIQTELTTNHIFKFPYVPDTQDIKRQFICFDMSLRSNKVRKTFKNMSLDFWVFCHKDIIKHSSGYNRPDLIDERIQTIFNGSSYFSVNPLVCVGDFFLMLGQNFSGRKITFESSEINKSQRLK